MQRLGHEFVSANTGEEAWRLFQDNDVDYFKAYNDHYGHFAGDEVLKAVAGILHQNMRPGGCGYRFCGRDRVGTRWLDGNHVAEAGG